jgi:signal transduction histidine kinase/tetratricopeptide (TPR) repeat protein
MPPDAFSPPLLTYFASEVEYSTLKLSSYPDQLVARASAAWYLRQFDPNGALVIANELVARFSVHDEVDFPDRWLQAIAHLIDCECAWMKQDVKSAESIAMRLLEQMGDEPRFSLLRSDTLRLLAGVFFEQRKLDQARTAIADARIVALSANDSARAMQCEITVFIWREFYGAPVDVLGAELTLSEVFMDDATVTALWHERKGSIACVAGDLRTQIASWSAAYFACVDSGQLHRACRLAGSIGAGYGNLDDLSSAAEWVSLALSIAEARNWPTRTASLLLQSARIAILLRQHDEAQRQLDAARDLISPSAPVNVRLHYFECRGLLDFERNQFASATTTYRALADLAEQTKDATYECEGLRGIAQCALLSNRYKEALTATAALKALLPKLDGSRYQMVAHQTIARSLLSAVAPEFAEQDRATLDEATHHIERAIALAATIGEYSIPHDLYEDHAALLARRGDYASAFKCMQTAKAAYTKSLDERASRKALALQIRVQSMQEKSVATHNKLLANAAMERADALERHNSVLAAIAAAGKLIADKLTVRDVALAVHDALSDLISFEGMSIFALSAGAKNRALAALFCRQNEIDVGMRDVELSDSKSVVSLCYLGARTINVLASDTAVDLLFMGAGFFAAQVGLYVPLDLRGETIGVLGIEAATARAFDELDVVLVRALAGYAAIALQHAKIHDQLIETVAQLRAVETALRAEKAETSLTASERDEALAFLAHDLRAPIAAIIEATNRGDTFVSNAQLNGNAKRALQLTERFLGLARLDRIADDSLHDLEFAGVVDDACETLIPIAVKLKKRLDVVPQFGCYISGHRDALSRLIINLVDNALRAARECVRVEVEILERSKSELGTDTLCLSVSDDGEGMPSAAIEVLTGRKGFVGQSSLVMRMGLLIVAKVAKIHHAKVYVHASTAGTTIRVLLPLLRYAPSDVS